MVDLKKPANADEKTDKGPEQPKKAVKDDKVFDKSMFDPEKSPVEASLDESLRESSNTLKDLAHSHIQFISKYRSLIVCTKDGPVKFYNGVYRTEDKTVIKYLRELMSHSNGAYKESSNVKTTKILEKTHEFDTVLHGVTPGLAVSTDNTRQELAAAEHLKNVRDAAYSEAIKNTGLSNTSGIENV